MYGWKHSKQLYFITVATQLLPAVIPLIYFFPSSLLYPIIHSLSEITPTATMRTIISSATPYDAAIYGRQYHVQSTRPYLRQPLG